MSLQSRQIPHDIVRAILDHLDHLPSLAAVSLTSRNYTAFAQRRLYHSVVLTATDNLKDTQISILLGFVKFLDGVPRICTYIHVLYIHSRRLPSFPIPVTQLHSVIRKLPALHTLTLKLIELRTGSELMCTKLDTTLTTIRLMDVYANRHVIPSLIHPLPQLYILDICGSILDVTLGEEQAASITIPHSPQCLKVKSGLGYTFLTDVGVTSSFSVDFIDITSPTDIHRISHFLSHRCRSLQHLFLNLCYFTASDGAQMPTLARPWPKLQSAGSIPLAKPTSYRDMSPRQASEGVPRVPYDVVESILDHLYDSAPTLHSFSLVSRQHTAPAQRRLFHSAKLPISSSINFITNQPAVRPEDFSHFLDTVPHIRHAISTLNVSSALFGLEEITVDDLYSIVQKLPVLRNLRLSHVKLKTRASEQSSSVRLVYSLVELKLMNVLSDEHSFATLLRPFSTPYTLDIFRLTITDTTDSLPIVKLDVAPQCLKIKHGTRAVFKVLTDLRVSTATSLSIDFTHMREDRDIYGAVLFLKNHCSNVRVLYLNMCRPMPEFGVRHPRAVLATACPHLETLHLVFSPMPSELNVATEWLGTVNPKHLLRIVIGLDVADDSTRRGDWAYEGNWRGLVSTLDRFPRLSSVRVLEYRAVEEADFIADLRTPLSSSDQSQLTKLFPSLARQGWLHFT
ncbi:hypothetical protein EUX98_g3106 [Antrodiella citrinella]|uniref:F-box domain-containing protein n=1 Tax=Antrodiella citrinella TaxID=2447956 RepID=A0A4S4MZJ9_9APHY|nr:hypothetical protein EUX98_g3106 [Antrodiella citrinella]